MSIHKSLVSQGKLKRHRNVLSRTERLDMLSKEGKRKDEDSVFGLAKVRNIKQKVKSKSKKEEAATAEATTEAVSTEATAPEAPAKSTDKEKPASKK